MRIVTYGAACSADGFIAGPAGALDWLHWSADANAIMADYWKTTDTILMGRKTWDIVVAQKGKGGPMRGMKSYVFSRTLERLSRKGVMLVRQDAGDFVRELKTQPGKGITVLGGADLGRSLFAAGVIDEVGFNMHPVLLGSGVPMFHDAGRRVDLELAECRAIHGGCVYVRYRVAS